MDKPDFQAGPAAVFVSPRLRVQNANAISSYMTWGFPAISNFTGAMTAVGRRLGPESGVHFDAVGVVCHDFEAQVTESGYTHAFKLARHPVKANGQLPAIVETGRAHLEITLVFNVRLAPQYDNEIARADLSAQIAQQLAGMRIAGGSVFPSAQTTVPMLEILPQQDEERDALFKRIKRRLLPGFALIARDDLLADRLDCLQAEDPTATALDAWLDLSRWNSRAVKKETLDANGDPAQKIEWETETRVGWIVPIPVGFRALSDVQAPGTVANARDSSVPFRFVEPVWSIGEWISPHRFSDLESLLWRAETDHQTGLYRCRNQYRCDINS